jgi:hypothetical protein
MNDPMGFSTTTTLSAPTEKIQKVQSLSMLDAEKCEIILNLGVFFDGTRNNMAIDKPKLQHTNIVRLFENYKRSLKDGYDCLYIPGVGTPFPEIGETGESNLGNGFAIGCEERVLYALCWLLNAFHRAGVGPPLWNDDEVKALCRTQSRNLNFTHHEDAVALKKLGLDDGLRMGHFFGGERESILNRQVKQLRSKLAHSKPRVKECFIDIFGFSRGAAEARVFTNWLNQLLDGGKFAGVPLHFRFLGIFDTVASAGFFSGMAGGVVGGDGGHSGWAHHESLVIPASVKNCVHMVAMHELRKNFPLDSVRLKGVLPPNCHEFAYPGAHSDVGGGYAPGELGVSVGATPYESDSLKLSQIPLKHMFECAIAAGAPLALKSSGSPYNSFAIHPQLEQVFRDFLAVSGPRPRQMHEWSQPYLNWRNEIRNRFSSQQHVLRATEKDRKLLIEFNKWFCAHEQVLRSRTTRNVQLLSFVGLLQRIPEVLLDPEAQNIWTIANSAAPTCASLHTMFDGFVHDSMAGFNHQSIELSGYWRYRKGFLGTELVRTADASPENEQTRNMA